MSEFRLCLVDSAVAGHRVATAAPAPAPDADAVAASDGVLKDLMMLVIRRPTGGFSSANQDTIC